jgi:hypothetical protein
MSILLLLLISVTGCNEEAAPTTALVDSSIENPTGVLSKGRVIHRVSVGGADICEAFGAHTGCDANFSLVAIEKADGSVSGQWQDSFGHGNGGFHATITCLSVNGKEAWVSGVITSGNAGDTDLTGLPVITRVKDNGKSGDQISFSFIGDLTSCFEEPDLPLNNLTHGQVKVR